MEAVEFRIILGNVLEYRCLKIFSTEKAVGTNADGDDRYEESVTIQGYTEWQEVPLGD